AFHAAPVSAPPVTLQAEPVPPRTNAIALPVLAPQKPSVGTTSARLRGRTIRAVRTPFERIAEAPEACVWERKAPAIERQAAASPAPSSKAKPASLSALTGRAEALRASVHALIADIVARRAGAGRAAGARAAIIGRPPAPRAGSSRARRGAGSRAS